VLAESIAGHRVQEVVQPDAERVVLTSWGRSGAEGARHHLVFACGPSNARISQLARPPRALPRPPAFAQYLKAHVVGARITGAALRGGDRLAALSLETRDGAATLLLQIMGRRSNLVLLAADERVVATLRPLEVTRPELALGEPWRDPASGPPREGEDRFAEVPDAGLLAAIEALYAVTEAEGAREGLARSVERALKKEDRRLTRKLEKLEQELAAAQTAMSLSRQGELLKSSLARVSKGDSEVSVEDFETGESLVIALDASLTPAENLQALFKRYQKAVRRLAKGGAQDDAVRQARRALDVLLRDFPEVADDPQALAEFAERPGVKALLDRRTQTPSASGKGAAGREELRLAGRTLPRRLAPRRYRTAGELEIWVGRSDAGNDFLTTRLARGKDLFFHLDGAPGSHVILRTEGRSDPPSEAVLDACELAVHFSKAKKATRADVHVVPIKNVKKPKGAKPGLVTVHGGKNVHLRRMATRLERILAACLD
jgi:predicted ribosome quality control (RQC) complex YloA/Tae2 family protein